MRIPSRLWLAVLLGLSLPLAAVQLQAQACFGNASFATNHLQMNGEYVFNSDFEELGASFVSGSNSVFAGFGVASTSFEGGDANIALRGNLGYQVPVSSSGKIQVCPVLKLSFGLPTENYNGTGGDLTAQSYGIGLGIGGELMRAERLALVPALLFGVQRDIAKVSGGLAPDTAEDTFAYAGFALGFVMNDALSFRPSVQFPVDSRFDAPIFTVGLSLNYGGRR